MKVKELIEKLSEYNPEAEVKAVAHNYCHEFSISYGSSDGITKNNCDMVGFYINKLNSSDADNKN